MRLSTVLAGLVVLFLFVQCGQSGATAEGEVKMAQLTVPDTVDLAFQDTLLLSGNTDWIVFDTLAHDSRCATGAMCVWEGNAEMGFTLYQAGAYHTFALNTHARYRTDTTLTARSFSVLDLMPYPHIDSTYQTDQFTVRVYVDQ